MAIGKLGDYDIRKLIDWDWRYFVVGGVLIALAWFLKKMGPHAFHQGFPGYFTFIVLLAVIPAALLESVVQASVEQERLEGWIMSEVERGVPRPGLYPPNADAAARYAAWSQQLPD